MIAKEMHDKHFDPFDFAATAGGGLLTYLANKQIRVGNIAFKPGISFTANSIVVVGTF